LGSIIEQYRVGLSASGEFLLGPTSNLNNSWWAFDAIALGKAPGLPSGVTTNPLIGWIPGSSTYQNKPITQEQVQTCYRNAGWKGIIQLVAPGTGATPTVYNQRIAANLSDVNYDGYHTMNTVAVWHLVFAKFSNTSNVIIDISSVYDNSGTPKGNHCDPNDVKVSMSQADPWVSQWSSTRWISYLAHINHYQGLTGENPGSNSPSDMDAVFPLAYSCNLTSLMWAFDTQLYSGNFATINDYAQIIAIGPIE